MSCNRNRKLLSSLELSELMALSSSDSEYVPSGGDDDSIISSDDDIMDEGNGTVEHLADTSASASELEPEGRLPIDEKTETSPSLDAIIWNANYTNGRNFTPKLKIPAQKEGLVLADLSRASTEFDIFMKLFPRSLFIHIASFTNED